MDKKEKFKKLIEQQVKTKVTIIDKETKFKFVCDGCRDGSSSCCCNRGNDRIIINPYDIYRLQKGLGKTSREIIDKYTEIITGCNSGYPLFLLGVKKIHTEEEICPFIRKKTFENGTSRRICSVHNFKPGVCSIFPLGRVTESESGDIVYILQDVNCGLPPKETDPELTIKDFVPDLENGDRAFIEYSELMKKANDIMNLQKLHNSELVPDTLKAMFRNVFLYVLCDFDVSKGYFEQMEERSKKTLEFTTLMLNAIMKYDKSVKGKMKYQNITKEKNPVYGYRTEQLYGEGYRDAASVMAHEVFEMNNTDILDTLSETILKGTEIGKQLEVLSSVICEEIEDEELNEFLDEAFDNEEVGIEYFNEVLRAIKKETGKDIRYVLWLCDSIEDIKKEYEMEGENFTLFDRYEVSDVVLSDLGAAGKLYGYEKDPSPVDL